jgi:phosphate-selective porin OprO/OprP
MKSAGIYGLAIFIGFSLTTIPAFGQVTDREKELMEMIRKLDERVQKLEKRLEESESTNKSNVKSVETKSETGEEKEKKDYYVPKDKDLQWYWKEGIRFDSHDGDFKLKFGGRIQSDSVWFSPGDELDAARMPTDGHEFRRARIFIGGTIYKNFEFKAQYDFAGGDTDFKDVWISAKKVPIFGTLKVGHFKEPFGLDNMTSSKVITFMERSLPTALTPGRNSGLAMNRSELKDRIGYSFGVFRDSDDFGTATGTDYNITGRIHGRPWLNEDEDKYLHVGASASYKNIDGTIRYRQRPEIHLSDRFVDTNPVPADSAFLWGTEAALVLGSFSLQGEYIATDVDAPTGIADYDFDGYYAQASYILTGENRGYKDGSGSFDKIKPKNPFKGFGKGGKGAWEIAARYSNLNLDDGLIRGGEIDNVSLGLNWYINTNLRLALNYIHGEVERDVDTFIPIAIIPGYDDDFDAIMTRLQVVW